MDRNGQRGLDDERNVTLGSLVALRVTASNETNRKPLTRLRNRL
jgi:hypothetical protein